MKEPALLVDSVGMLFKAANPSKWQDLFRHITNRAAEKGMVVNTKKPGLLCMSAATSFRPEAHLWDAEGSKIGSIPRLKVLGFFFDQNAGG